MRTGDAECRWGVCGSAATAQTLSVALSEAPGAVGFVGSAEFFGGRRIAPGRRPVAHSRQLGLSEKL
jgi:hypothetical protein